jgi:hypothetical protein
VTGFCESLINAIAFLGSMWKAGMCDIDMTVVDPRPGMEFSSLRFQQLSGPGPTWDINARCMLDTEAHQGHWPRQQVVAPPCALVQVKAKSKPTWPGRGRRADSLAGRG